MNEVDSRDENGHYCGQNAETGEMTPSPIQINGYCGPACRHCAPKPVYVVQGGIWVCAADFDYEKGADV